MKVVVTGGAGSIGSHLVEGLSPDNEVIVLDNMVSSSLTNLERSKDKITFMQGVYWINGE